jgi:hypothetical protein
MLSLLNHSTAIFRDNNCLVASNSSAYNISARNKEKTLFSNNSPIVTEVCLTRHYIEAVVFILFRACIFLRELLCRRCLAMNYPGAISQLEKRLGVFQNR